MATTPAPAASTPTETDKACPNCGGPLFSGIANGGILACNNGAEPPEGCLTAWDPKVLDAEPEHGIGPYSVDVSDKAPVAAEGNTTPPDPNPTKEPYVGPDVTPSSVGVGEDVTPLVAAEAPVADKAVTAPPPPPAVVPPPQS